MSPVPLEHPCLPLAWSRLCLASVLLGLGLPCLSLARSGSVSPCPCLPSCLPCYPFPSLCWALLVLCSPQLALSCPSSLSLGSGLPLGLVSPCLALSGLPLGSWLSPLSPLCPMLSVSCLFVVGRVVSVGAAPRQRLSEKRPSCRYERRCCTLCGTAVRAEDCYRSGATDGHFVARWSFLRRAFSGVGSGASFCKIGGSKIGSCEGI